MHLWGPLVRMEAPGHSFAWSLGPSHETLLHCNYWSPVSVHFLEDIFLHSCVAVNRKEPHKPMVSYLLLQRGYSWRGRSPDGTPVPNSMSLLFPGVPETSEHGIFEHHLLCSPELFQQFLNQWTATVLVQCHLVCQPLLIGSKVSHGSWL